MCFTLEKINVSRVKVTVGKLSVPALSRCPARYDLCLGVEESMSTHSLSHLHMHFSGSFA